MDSTDEFSLSTSEREPKWQDLLDEGLAWQFVVKCLGSRGVWGDGRGAILHLICVVERKCVRVVHVHHSDDVQAAKKGRSRRSVRREAERISGPCIRAVGARRSQPMVSGCSCV